MYFHFHLNIDILKMSVLISSLKLFNSELFNLHGFHLLLFPYFFGCVYSPLEFEVLFPGFRIELVDLVGLKSFSLFVLWEVSHSPSTMADSFSGYSNLGRHLWSFRA